MFLQFPGKKRLLLGAAFFFFGYLSLWAQDDALAAESHRAKQLMGEGRFAEAIPIYRKLVDAVPGNSNLLLNLALAESMGGHLREALPHFQTVLKSQPRSVPALTSLAMVCLQLNRPAGAIDPLKTLLTLEPQNRNARGMLAGAYLSLDRPREAATEYRGLAESDAGDAKAWYGLGTAYEALANRSFAQLQKAGGESPYLALLLGDARLQKKQYRSAFFFYKQAQKQLPDAPGLHAALAKLYRETDHPDWAAEQEKAQAAQPNCAAHTSECAFFKGDFLAAAGSADASPAGLFWVTRAYTQLAAQAFDQLGHLPESSELHAIKAQVLDRHGNHLDAAREWKTALTLAPGDEKLQSELAASLFEAHAYAELKPLLEQLLAKQNDASDWNYMLGETLWRLQQPAEGEPYLEKALAVDPNLLPAHAALGLVESQLGKSGQAIPHLQKALALDDDGSLHYSLARAYQAAGDAAAAEKAMSEYQAIRDKNQQINDQVAKEAEITRGPGE